MDPQVASSRMAPDPSASCKALQSSLCLSLILQVSDLQASAEAVSIKPSFQSFCQLPVVTVAPACRCSSSERKHAMSEVKALQSKLFWLNAHLMISTHIQKSTLHELQKSRHKTFTTTLGQRPQPSALSERPPFPPCYSMMLQIVVFAGAEEWSCRQYSDRSRLVYCGEDTTYCCSARNLL